MAEAFLVELIRLVFLGSVGVSIYIWLMDRSNTN